MNLPRVSKISVGRLCNFGNYEHIRYEVTVDIPEGVDVTKTLTTIETALNTLAVRARRSTDSPIRRTEIPLPPEGGSIRCGWNNDTYTFSAGVKIYAEWPTDSSTRSSGERSLCPENMQPCDMGCSGGWCVTLHGSPGVAAAHTDTDAIRSRQLSGIAARVAKVERSSTPPEARALPEWAKDLESCWAEWTGGHITTDTFAERISEVVTKHIIHAGYPTPDSIPVADILRQIEHIKANAKSLASFAGQKEEARCRELCALYLHDFIVNHKLAGYVSVKK